MKTTFQKKEPRGGQKTPVVINYATTVSLTVEKVAAYELCHASPIHRLVQISLCPGWRVLPIQKGNIYAECFVLWRHTDSWISDSSAHLCVKPFIRFGVSVLQVNCKYCCNTMLCWLQRELEVLSNHENLIFWCTTKNVLKDLPVVFVFQRKVVKLEAKLMQLIYQKPL